MAIRQKVPDCCSLALPVVAVPPLLRVIRNTLCHRLCTMDYGAAEAGYGKDVTFRYHKGTLFALTFQTLGLPGIPVQSHTS